MAEVPDAALLSASSELAEEAIRTLLAERPTGGTICPSEAARLIAGPDGDWRDAMHQVHQAVDRIHCDGAIALSWKSKPVIVREGPYRIGLPE